MIDSQRYNYYLTSVKSWNVQSTTSVKWQRRQRRISVVIYQAVPTFTKDKAYSFEMVYVVIMAPTVKKTTNNHENDQELESNMTSKSGDNSFHSNSEQDSMISDIVDESRYSRVQWEPKYKIHLKDFSIRHQKCKNIYICISYVGIQYNRKLRFASQDNALKFISFVEEQKALQHQRNYAKMHASLRGISLPDWDESIVLLLEIIGAEGLVPVHTLMNTCKPYVQFEVGGTVLHQTNPLSKVDPVWTVQTGAFFLFNITVKELFSYVDAIAFIVRDDGLSKKVDALGVAMVSPRDLYLAKEERLVYPLHSCHKNSRRRGRNSIYSTFRSTNLMVPRKSSTLAIRCRRATSHDKKFMSNFQTRRNEAGIMTLDHGHGKSHHSLNVVKQRKRSKIINGQLKIYYKIRPHPDPNRPEQTKWMTKSQIDMEVLQPSHYWIDVGSGSLATIYLEILSCNQLPNLDTGEIIGNLTDSIVQVVYEDCVVRTCVIEDCLSPCYMPWTKRAFILHMEHTSSPLCLGVFDKDKHFGVYNEVGRVSVDLSNLRPNTLYIMDYHLYIHAEVEERTPRGSIKIRLRIDVPNDRSLLLCNLRRPPIVYVNVIQRNEYRAVKKTCQSGFDHDLYSMKAIAAYFHEIMSYTDVIYFIRYAFVSVIFWRGQHLFHLRIPSLHCNKAGGFWDRHTKRIAVNIPTHSIIVFLVAVIVVEHPNYIPSVFMAGMGWVLIATMEFRSQHPNPWYRCRTFHELFCILVTGRSTRSRNISKNDNINKIHQFKTLWRQRIENLREVQEEERKEREEWLKGKELNSSEIHTKTNRLSIDPLKPYLYPIQQQLAFVIICLRHLKNVILWEECYLSFWLSLFFFVIAFFCLFIPWNIVLRCIFRIIAWIFLGPGMKLIDLYGAKSSSEDEREAKRKKRRKVTESNLHKVRIEHENAIKLKDMKVYLFGKYIVKVPIWKEDRYRDTPLASSTAEPMDEGTFTMAKLAMIESRQHKARACGQNLLGVMIPKIGTIPEREAPTGQAISPMHKDWLEKNEAILYCCSYSTARSVIIFISIIVFAGIVSWFITPLIIILSKWLIKVIPFL